MQTYSFHLTESKNRHITREPGGEVASQQGVPASVRASTTSSSLNTSYLDDAFDYLVRVPFYAVSELNSETQKVHSRSGMQLSEARHGPGPKQRE